MSDVIWIYNYNICPYMGTPGYGLVRMPLAPYMGCHKTWRWLTVNKPVDMTTVLSVWRTHRQDLHIFIVQNVFIATYGVQPFYSDYGCILSQAGGDEGASKRNAAFPWSLILCTSQVEPSLQTKGLASLTIQKPTYRTFLGAKWFDQGK